MKLKYKTYIINKEGLKKDCTNCILCEYQNYGNDVFLICTETGKFAGPRGSEFFCGMFKGSDEVERIFNQKELI